MTPSENHASHGLGGSHRDEGPVAAPAVHRRRSTAHAGRVRRAASRGTTAMIALTAIAALAPAAAATPGHLHRLVLRLPHTAVETGRAHRRSVVGSATLQASTAWNGGDLTHAGTVDELHVTLSPSCTASIEVTTWAGRLKRSARLEIESIMNSRYSMFAPDQPLHVPLVTGYTPGSPRENPPGRGPFNSVWQLDGPEAPSGTEERSGTSQPASSEASPLYGVLIARLHPRALWASLTLGVRATSACTSTLTNSYSQLAQELETIMLNTVFKATAS